MGYVFDSSGNEYSVFFQLPADQAELYQRELRTLTTSVHFAELE